MNEITFDYRATVRDNILCTLLYFSRSGVQFIANAIFPLMGVAVLIVSTKRYGAPRATDYLLALMCFGFTPCLLLVIICIGRLRTRGIDLTQHFAVSDSGVAVSGALARTEIKWEAFKKAVETSHHVILFYTVAGALVLPKYVLDRAGVTAEFKQMIARKLGARARLKGVQPAHGAP